MQPHFNKLDFSNWIIQQQIDLSTQTKNKTIQPDDYVRKKGNKFNPNFLKFLLRRNIFTQENIFFFGYYLTGFRNNI